ncbi:hypothetical protein [uncultured Microscilla sp.]|uniref:hypothetical protein n=1 Tax=uncultured Microscilla sp. TaxID=432653 RepID=UPI00260429FC|nr:hypothetical protein [uncultured Microscilla sp.]
MKFGNCKICGAPPNKAQIEQLEALPPKEKEAIIYIGWQHLSCALATGSIKQWNE